VSSGVAQRMPAFLGAYLDRSTGSYFPLFPFSAFILAGTVAGAAIAARSPRFVIDARCCGVWRFWSSGGCSLFRWPDAWISGSVAAYTLMRLGGVLLILRLVEIGCQRNGSPFRALALLGHETLQHSCFIFSCCMAASSGPRPC